MLAAVAVVAGCGAGDAALGEARRPARQLIVGIDISGSRSPTQLREAEELLHGVVSKLGAGDRLVLIEAYQAHTDEASQQAFEFPSVRRPDKPTGGEKKRVEYARTGALAVLPSYFTRSKQILTTDLTTTLFRAADHAKARSGDTTIVLLLSDMLNATPELNMERRGGIPGANWIETRRRESRLPDLEGVCVYAVGAKVSTERGAQVRRFWAEYLEASGARLGGFREMVANPEEIRC